MPVNINLLSDDTIAKGVTPAPWGDLPTAFWSGQDRAQQQQLQNLFSEGIPKNPDGTPNYGKMAEMLARSGGAPQLQNVIGLTNLQAQQGLPPIPSVTMPPESMPQRPPPVPSIQRTGGLPVEPDQGVGVPRPPGQNLTSDTEAPGSARMSVDGGPEQPIQVASNASNVPVGAQFRQAAPTPAQPVSGPPADRFAQIPSIPAQQASPNFNADTAARWDAIGNNALEAARRADLAGAKGMAETYRAKATQAFSNSKDIREGLIGSQRKQAEVQVEQEKGVLDEAKKNYATAQSGNYRLGLIDKSIKDLGPNWTGAGADVRAGLARSYNTTIGLIPGLDQETRNSMQINPAKIATWEDFNKQSLNLGFELARTLGAREAMQIVQQATASVPNAGQSYWGARLVASAMRQSFQRQEDYYNFVVGLRRNGQSLLDADARFNAQNPVQQYVAKATSVVPPPRAIQFLQQNPTPQNKKFFDQTYGDGATIGVFGTK